MILSISKGTEWSTIQVVIEQVFLNYELHYPWIVRHEVLLQINCVNNKMIGDTCFISIHNQLKVNFVRYKSVVQNTSE